MACLCMKASGLCSLFNLFLKYGYLPRAFVQSVIVPIVKDKCGNILSNGTRQGGVLSSYLFSRYVRDMIRAVMVGCLQIMLSIS